MLIINYESNRTESKNFEGIDSSAILQHNLLLIVESTYIYNCAGCAWMVG